MTNMCATTLAKEKQGELAKQNGAMASLGSSFPCLCVSLPLNGTVQQHHSVLLSLYYYSYIAYICNIIWVTQHPQIIKTANIVKIRHP